MATTITHLSNSGKYPIATLDTYNYTAVTTAYHYISVKLICANPMTGITVLINQNGTTIASIVEPPAASNEINCSILAAVTSNDTIAFVITSTNAADSNPNVLQGYVRLTLSNVPC